MNVRIYPTVSREIIKSTDLTFSDQLVGVLNEILTEDVVTQLSEERYRVLMESMFDNNDNPSNYTSVLQMYLSPDGVRTRKSFETLILCYASVGVIPVTQKKLGAVIEQFLLTTGGWEVKTVEYVDAIKFRLSGSFERGKRR